MSLSTQPTAIRRTALVTGASRGIGRAVALGLAADGVDLIGVHFGRDAESAAVTIKELQELGVDAVALQADLSTNAPDATARLAADFLAAAEATVGRRRTDILVNNAGISIPDTLAGLTEDVHRRTVEVNLTAPLFLIKALAPTFNDGGRVINISTGFTRVAAPTHLAYSAAKAGLNGLTLALAPELAKSGVTINAVNPGVTETDMNADWLASPGGRETAASLSVFGRVGTVDEVAHLVRYLASPAAGWTTGQVLDATGGSRL